METIAEVAAAEKDALVGRLGIDRRQMMLCRQSPAVEDRMGVIRAPEDFRRVDTIGVVEADKIILALRHTLQAVHVVVGGRTFPFPARLHPVIPRRPRQLAPRHDRGVGMEQRFIGLVTEGRQQFFLQRCGMPQQRQRLVGMRGEDDTIESVRGAVLGADHDLIGAGRDRRHGRGRMRLRQIGQQALHVFPRTAVHRVPGMMRAHPEESMVVEKTHQSGRRKIERPAGRDAPDGRTHGHEVKTQKVITQTMETHKLIEGHGLERVVSERSIGHAEEAQNLREELEEAWTDQVRALGEDAVETHAVVFNIEFLVTDTETHFGRLDRDAQLVEEAHEIRVGHFVEDHEAGVDGHAASFFVDFDRVRVTANVFLALEDRHVIALAQQPRGTQSGDTAADDSKTFLAHSAECSVGVPADEPPTIGAGDGAATFSTLTLTPARRSDPPRGRRSPARAADC